MKPSIVNLTINRGSTFAVQFDCNDEAGDPEDLTGWSVWAHCKEVNYGHVTNLAPTITDATGGIVTINLTDETTATFKDSENTWDLMFENAAGERLGPYIKGSLTIETPTTQP